MKGFIAVALLGLLAAQPAVVSARLLLSEEGQRLNATAEAVAAARAGGLQRKGGQEPAPELHPDMSEDLGSITEEESTLTHKVVNYEKPKKTLDDVATDVSEMDCTALEAHLEGLVKDTEKHRKQAFWKKIEGMKINSMEAPPDGDWHNQVERTEAFQRLDGNIQGLKLVNKALDESYHSDLLAKKLFMESLRVSEILGLKCGATDGYCKTTGMDLLNKYRDLTVMKRKSDAMMGEAGWIEAEASVFGATPEKKKAAEMRSLEAWKEAHATFGHERSTSVGIMMKAAACAGKPPKGPWTNTADRCNLKPEDPVMKALMKEDPVEFVKRWELEIAKQIGVSPLYVKVDVGSCLKEGAMDYSTKTFSQQPSI